MNDFRDWIQIQIEGHPSVLQADYWERPNSLVKNLGLGVDFWSLCTGLPAEQQFHFHSIPNCNLAQTKTKQPKLEWVGCPSEGRCTLTNSSFGVEEGRGRGPNPKKRKRKRLNI
jgi:hypothetical protein